MRGRRVNETEGPVEAGRLSLAAYTKFTGKVREKRTIILLPVWRELLG